MTVHRFLSVPSCRHWRHCHAFPPFLGHSLFHRWWRPSLFRKRWDWETFRFSISAPQVSACGSLLSQSGLVFLLVGMGASTCGGFQGFSRSRSCLLRPVGPPCFESLGCRATWSPWLLVSWAVASVTFRLRAATAAAPVRHTLRHPCFSSRKLRLRGCRRCLRLLILSRRSPLGRSPCSVLLFGPVFF